MDLTYKSGISSIATLLKASRLFSRNLVVFFVICVNFFYWFIYSLSVIETFISLFCFSLLSITINVISLMRCIELRRATTFCSAMQDNDQVLELSREIREAFNTNFALTKDGLSEMKSNFNLSYSSINPASYLKIAKSLKDIQDDVISVSERHPRIIDAYDSALLCFGSFASSYWLHQSLFALILVGLGCLSIVF